MKVLGVVQWTNRDKRGSPIAGVRPLIEIQKGEWRPIDAAEEFPSQGQVFWPNAQSAAEDSMIIFTPEPNAGQKDEFRVVDPKPAHEVLDLRRYGTATEVRAGLVDGLRLLGPIGTIRTMVWCKHDMLVGPVELNRTAPGILKLTGGNLARVPSFTGDNTHLRSVVVDKATRWLRVEDGPPSGYVDWDDDATVLRRALDAAVRVARQSGHDTGQTKKQIEEAAKALAIQGIGPDAELDRYRVERALALLRNTDAVRRSAGEFVEILREHPAIKASLEALSEKVRADVELSARAELELRLVRERAALKGATEAHARAQSQLESKEQELQRANDQLVEVQGRVAIVAKEAEAALETRILAALARPMDLFAEVSVLRPLLGAGGSRLASSSVSTTSTKLDWSRGHGEDIRDKASLRRMLTSAARARGIDPSLMLQVHAATVAHLMPVALGSGALAALSAYAHGACGGRLLIIHVSPSAIQPHDFDEHPGGGLVAATTAARDIDGVSLVILEGANRSPLEASVVPLLELADIGLAPLSSARGLRLAASLVAGATTVPVTPQLWSHATAIYSEQGSLSGDPVAPGDVTLSSELLVPGEAPMSVIDALLDTWPDCRELRPAMSRFGSALVRFYDDEPRVTDALLHGLLLPYVATALNMEEQAEALGRAKDDDGTIALRLRQLRRRLT